MTHNKSFIDISNELEKKNIKNKYFLLNTFNPKLQKLNSFEIYNHFINCDNEYFPLIIEECEHNIWFFFREIARVGQYAAPFQLTKERLLFIWCYINGISCVNLYKGGVTTVLELLYIYHKIFSKEANLGCARKFEFIIKDYSLTDDIMNANKDLLSMYTNRVHKKLLDNTDVEYTFMTGSQETFYNISISTSPDYDKFVERFVNTDGKIFDDKYFTFGFDISEFIESIPFMISNQNEKYMVYANIATSDISKISEMLMMYIKYSIPRITLDILDEKNKKNQVYKIILENE